MQLKYEIHNIIKTIILADHLCIDLINHPKLTSFMIYLTDKKASVTVGL